MIAIDSTPSNGNKDLAIFVGEFCRDLGFNVSYQKEVLNGLDQINVIIRPGEILAEQEIAFLSHLDTHDPGSYALWTKTMSNPFKLSIHGKDIFGLGSANAKLDFLCKIFAAKEFLGRAYKVPFVLVGTYGEQDGMALLKVRFFLVKQLMRPNQRWERMRYLKC